MIAKFWNWFVEKPGRVESVAAAVIIGCVIYAWWVHRP